MGFVFKYRYDWWRESTVTKGEAVIVEYCLVKNCSTQTCAFLGVFSCKIFIVSVFIIYWLRLSVIFTSLTSAFSFLRSAASGDWSFKEHLCRSQLSYCSQPDWIFFLEYYTKFSSISYFLKQFNLSSCFGR